MVRYYRGDGMFTDVVKNLEVNGLEKTMFHNMAETFETNLPDVLYRNHYELSEDFGYSPMQWKKFLKMKEVSRIIEMEVAGMAEIAARASLKTLQSGKAKSADIQAAKQLLDKSQLLKQKTEQPTQVVITRMPPKEKMLHGE